MYETCKKDEESYRKVGGNDMKKRILSMIITLALVFGCGAMQVFATDAKVTASLPATKKVVTSGYAVFSASKIYGYAYDISKHNIAFTAYGKNNISGSEVRETGFICAPGASNSSQAGMSHSMHRIEIRGDEGGKSVTGCIGYGYIE